MAGLTVSAGRAWFIPTPYPSDFRIIIFDNEMKYA
jgi:hypothetical protein